MRASPKFLLAAVCLAAATVNAFSAPRNFDLILAGGTVIDGTGAARRIADVGVIGDTIEAIGDLSKSTATRKIDARGRLVTPGFIDAHAHVADNLLGSNGLLSPDKRRRAAQNFLLQGITTGMGNPDGSQVEPVITQRRRLEAAGIGINVALFNGHNYLRAQVMGKDTQRPAKPAEIERMQAMLVKSLTEEGSFGMSTGLEYDSMLFSDTHELVALASALVPYGGIYTAHQRSQGIAPMWYKPSVHKAVTPPTFEGSLRESIAVAETGVTTVVTHIKAWGPGYRGHADKYIALLQDARDRGARIFCDLYPFVSAGSDGGFVMLPPWLFGVTGMAQVNTDRAAAAIEKTDYRAAFEKEIQRGARVDDIARDVQNQVDLKGGAEQVFVLNYPDASYVGKNIATLMHERNLSLVDLAIALQREGDPTLPGGVKLRAVSMELRDVQAFYRQSWTMTGTDGWIVLPEEAVGPAKYLSTNQRCFGTFIRRLTDISIEQKVDSLEEAVRKSSGLTAEVFNIPDRGRIAPGMKADLLIIDLENLRDHTTLAEPSVYPTGVEYVWVNGALVVEKGKCTLALPGRVLDPVRRAVKTPAS
ncbi:N-acyl-D-amino-acid deacylase family protein [Oleiharenicola lentus]|uniref:N-acyl-D-amino-acid deacylase family protein n=1 Tax=Oleiharenicola lentus TaxID=2508720 RepID=UPI003F66D020